MKPEEFVEGLQCEIIDANLDIYKDLFNNTKLENIQDKYWVKALPFYNKLNDNDKKVFFQILRQVSVDTISNILALLDGITFLKNQDEEFKLLSANEEELNGDLQDIFLELENNE